MSFDEKPETVRLTLRIEKSIIEACRDITYYHDLDDVHALIRYLIRRERKTLEEEGKIPILKKKKKPKN